MYCRIYVAECVSPGYFYVGSTTRRMFDREIEHQEGWGSQWTKLHGFKTIVFAKDVDVKHADQLEDDLTVYLQCRYGYRYVRGGNRTATCEKKLQRWLHPCFKSVGATDVLPLHSRPMSKFPAELRALIDAFEVVCGLEDPDHLDSNV